MAKQLVVHSFPCGEESDEFMAGGIGKLWFVFPRIYGGYPLLVFSEGLLLRSMRPV